MISVVGPYVIPTSGSNQQVDTFGTLKSRAAEILHGSGKTKILELAGQGILSGIDYINMHSLFNFSTEQQASVAITAATNTIAIPNSTHAIRAIQLVDSAGVIRHTLRFVDWDKFQVMKEDQNDDGIPDVWTAKNWYDDGTIEVYPIPDADAATYTATITYYTRIERPSKDSDLIDAPRELGEVLVSYGHYYLLWMRERETGAWSRAERNFKERLELFKYQIKRQEPRMGRRQILLRSSERSREFDPLS